MASSLQKVTFTSLEDMLEQINNNFALIQNSPYFKGVPGDKGEQGLQGITGLRGTKIYAANFEKFRAQFPELQNESISTLNAEWINAKIEEDDAQHTNYNKILVALNAEELLEDDIVLFQSDLSLWTYDQDNTVLTDSGIRFASDANAKNIIDALIKTSLEEYVASLEAATMYVKEYPTIATNDGKRGTDYARINTITSYIPYLRKAGVPAKFEVTTPNIDNAKKHKYFAINDDYTNIGDDYDTSVPFNMTTISGSVREYVRTLQNGTEQTMAGNIVNPTYDKMPAMVVMQNNYKSGLVIGHSKSTTMSQYGVIYKNSEGQFCFRREHRWPASRLSEQVTEFIIGSGEFLFNGTLNLLAGNTMYSDFLDTLTTRNTIRIGYGNAAGNTLLFDALNYKFTNIPAKSLLELDKNGRVLTKDIKGLDDYQLLHHIKDNQISDTSSDDRKTWFDTYYRPESEYYDKSSLIHGIMTEYTGAMMYDCIQDQLDDIWRKNEFYVLESSSTYQDVIIKRLTDKVPSLHLNENLDISSSKTTSDNTTQKTISHYKILDVRTSTPYGGANDYIGIGLYYNEIIPKELPMVREGGLSRRTNTQLPARLERMSSLLNIELDWNKVILRAMPSLSVFVVDENQELSSSYQFANPYESYEEDVYNDIASRLDTDDFKYPNSFDKYAADEWYDSNMTSHGGYSGSNPTTKDEYRILTGRHYVTLMRIIGTITSWIKDTFARKEDLQRVANDVVPEGAIIAWNPLITSFNYLPQATARLSINLEQPSNETPSVNTQNVRQIVQETLVATQEESERIRNTVLTTEASTTMQDIASATAANRTTSTPSVAAQSLASKSTQNKNTTTTTKGSVSLKTPTDLTNKSEISGGLGKATGKNGLKEISFSSAKKEFTKKASQSLVDTGKYLAISSMDSNTDFKLPIGWVPCIGKSLHEVSGCSIGNIGTIHSIYRVPDLRDKIIVGYYWESTSNINAPYITGNGNYQPDLVTLENKTIIPSSLASSMMAKANMSKAPTIMSTTTDSKYAKADTIKGVVTNSSVETEEYYISQQDNQVVHNSSEDKVDKFRYCPPAVRLCYIMKAPRPADGHGLYMQVSNNSYIRVYPLPTDKGFDEGQFPFFISENEEESGVSLITGRRFTTIIDDIPAELIDTGGEIIRNQTNIEKFSQIVEDFKSPTTAQGNGMTIKEVDTSKMSEEEQNQFNTLLGKMGVDVQTTPDTPLVIGAGTGKTQESTGNKIMVNNPTLLPSEQTETQNTSTEDSVQKTTTIVTNVGNKKGTVTRKNRI